MKISWGFRILILYLGFAGLIIFLVASSVNEKVDLVTPDYYAKELVYQNKMESINRNNNLENPTMIYWNSEGIRIEYPEEFEANRISGFIKVFRPSDKNLDFDVPILSDANHMQLVSGSLLETGMYRIAVEYSYNNEDYFTEKQIVVRE